MKDKATKPALPARIAAWGIAFLLTVTLTIAALGGPAAYHRILTDENLHISIATDESVIAEQTDRIAARIRELAEDYGFDADEVIGEISREETEEINRQAAEWWTRIVSEGIMDEIPVWTAYEQISQAVYDTMDQARYPDTDRDETAKGIVSEIEKVVTQTVMPFRKALVTVAVRYANRKIDLPGIIRFISEIPLIAGAMSLLFSGIIAFLLGKRIIVSLKYYGAAFAGAGLSSLAGILLVRTADISELIRAASERLDHQVQMMLNTVVTETWICTAVLFVAGMICLILYNQRSEI